VHQQSEQLMESAIFDMELTCERDEKDKTNEEEESSSFVANCEDSRACEELKNIDKIFNMILYSERHDERHRWKSVCAFFDEKHGPGKWNVSVENEVVYSLGTLWQVSITARFTLFDPAISDKKRTACATKTYAHFYQQRAKDCSKILAVQTAYERVLENSK